MTLKRFILDEYFGIGSVVIDTENENVRFKHENKLSMKQCCDLLNELHEENNELKRELDNIYLLIGKGDWSGLVDLLINDEKCKTKLVKSIK